MFLRDRWFESTVSPEDAISKYVSSPPTGMTNPPQNPKVRQALLDYLDQNGVEPDYQQSWPPPQPALGEPGAGWGPHSVRESEKGSPSRSSRTFRGSPSSSKQPSCGSESMMAAMRGRLRGAVSAPELARPGAELVRYDPLPTYSRRLHYGPGASQSASPKKSSPKKSARPLWHQTRGAYGEDSGLKVPRSGSQESMRASRDKDVDEEKGWKPKKPPVIITERHLSLGIESLRSQESLHRAAVSDRFKFSAEGNTRCKAVSIKGPGAVEPQGEWESDASLLNVFHNSAMRTVNPSRLDQLPDLTDKTKKKKKKQKEDDLDFLQMSDSGLFQAQYPTDESLMSIRRLRREYFPKEKPPTPAPVAAVTKIDLGGFSLLGREKKVYTTDE